MNTFFFHDSTFVKKDDKYYTKDGLNDEVFKKYSEFFGDLYVFGRYEELNDVNKIYINPENLINSANFFCSKNFFESILMIKKNIINCDFAILRVHSFISTIAYIFVKKRKIKFLVESVSCPFDCLWNHSFIGKTMAIIMMFITRNIIKKATYVSYVSVFLQSKYPSDAKSFLCSDVRLPNFPNTILEDRQDKIEKKNDNSLKICTIANVDVKYKGHIYVIKALSKLKIRGYSHNYYLIGGGSGVKLKKAAAKYKVDELIHFIGPVPHDRIFDYLKEMDIYIQPSDAESHGRVILEAEALAIPVIGSSTGGIPEIVDNNYVFERKKIKDLIDKILKISDKRNQLEQAKINFYYSKKFSSKILNNKRNAFYSKIRKDLFK
jgi:glycosyltransferase involved in cell wall biosynthesis